MCELKQALEGVVLDCQFQEMKQGLDCQPKQNFRSRQGFILVYDMSSQLHVNKLHEWVDLIFDQRTVSCSVVLVLGNKQETCPAVLMQKIEAQKKVI